MTTPYSIGYKKPPVAGQFKKGKSGNLKGRPKRSLDFSKNLIAELKSPVTVTEGGKTRKITKWEALMKSLVAHAIKGDKAMAKLILEIIKKLPKNAFDDDDVAFTVSVKSAKALEQFVEETGKSALEYDWKSNQAKEPESLP